MRDPDMTAITTTDRAGALNIKPGAACVVRHVELAQYGEDKILVHLDLAPAPPPDPTAEIMARLEDVREHVAELVGDAAVIDECLAQLTGKKRKSGDIDPAGDLPPGRNVDRCPTCDSTQIALDGESCDNCGGAVVSPEEG